MRKIVLIGYMASGKSTIGKIVAKKIAVRHVDLDNLIEKESKLSIENIFSEKGEIYFRKMEHTLFKKLCESNEPLIVSTGGGTPCYADNHLFLNADGVISIYLKASIDLLYDRLLTEKNKRPLVADKPEEVLKEFIAKQLVKWFKTLSLQPLFIEPGSPWENGFIESFNARMRDELLNGEIFFTLLEAKVIIGMWVKHYNTIRPHSSLGYKPPVPEALQPDLMQLAI